MIWLSYFHLRMRKENWWWENETAMKFILILLLIFLIIPGIVLSDDYKANVQRDEKGRIKRSSSSRYEFMKSTGYKNGRPGYVVDHIIPLACGGSDTPNNMQWQTIEEGKAKDKWERKHCE